MLSAFLAFLTAIPGIGNIVTAITSSVFDAKVKMYAARTGVTRDVALETIRSVVTSQQTHVTELQALSGVKPLMWLIIAFAIPVASYEAKVIVWDTMLDLGSTPAIHGQVAEWMTTIIGWIFGSSTALAGGSMALKAVKDLK